MYLQHFGLEKNPFSLSPDPRFLFLTNKHREALAALLFAITEYKGFMVMTDPWFDEYLYEVAVDKKYLSPELLAILDTKPVELAPWDPMGALA